MKNNLKIPEGIASREKYVALYIHPERHNKIYDYRAAKSEEGRVNKVQPDLTGGDIEFFSNVRTNSKGMGFNKLPEAHIWAVFYTCKLEKYFSNS